MLLLRRALRLMAVAALPLLALTVAPTDANAVELYCEIWYESPAEGHCFAAWLCEDGSGGWAYTDGSLC